MVIVRTILWWEREIIDREEVGEGIVVMILGLIVMRVMVSYVVNMKWSLWNDDDDWWWWWCRKGRGCDWRIIFPCSEVYIVKEWIHSESERRQAIWIWMNLKKTEKEWIHSEKTTFGENDHAIHETKSLYTKWKSVVFTTIHPGIIRPWKDEVFERI